MKLLVLDIDDTIVKTNADMIGVWKRYPDGTEKRLSTSEFAEDPDSADGGKSANVIFDYREFGDEEKVTNSINNGTPIIKNLRILDRCIKEGYEIAFLTARADEEMVYRVLSNYLKTSVAGEFLPVKLNRKYCFAINDPKYAGKLGNTDAEKKARVLRYLCREAELVKFVDDDLKNIRNARSLNLPNLRVVTAWKESTNLRKQLKENIGDSMVKVFIEKGDKISYFNIFDEVGDIQIGVSLHGAGDEHPNVFVSREVGASEHPNNLNELVDDVLNAWSSRSELSERLGYLLKQIEVEEFRDVGEALDSLLNPICEMMDTYTDKLASEVDQKITKLKQKLNNLQDQRKGIFYFRNTFCGAI